MLHSDFLAKTRDAAGELRGDCAAEITSLLRPDSSNAVRDGTTHLVMSPLEFTQRLAAPVPRPKLHLIRFHGVLAPNAKLRALVARIRDRHRT